MPAQAGDSSPEHRDGGHQLWVRPLGADNPAEPRYEKNTVLQYIHLFVCKPLCAHIVFTMIRAHLLFANVFREILNDGKINR